MFTFLSAFISLYYLINESDKHIQMELILGFIEIKLNILVLKLATRKRLICIN